MALLEAKDIRRSFYGLSALAGADVSVEAGTVTGLIGPNGAGKTTFFNCISGLIPPEGGRVVFDGPTSELTPEVTSQIYAREEFTRPVLQQNLTESAA
jgi:ABC-type branched-subunit amino acid transport system ATPase component